MSGISVAECADRDRLSDPPGEGERHRAPFAPWRIDGWRAGGLPSRGRQGEARSGEAGCVSPRRDEARRGEAMPWLRTAFAAPLQELR